MFTNALVHNFGPVHVINAHTHTQLRYHANTHYHGKQVGENPLCSACHALISSLWGFGERVCWLSSAFSKSLHLDASFLCHYSSHLLYTVSNSPDGFWQPESLQLGPLHCRLCVQANRNLTAEQPCRLCDSQWIRQSKVQKLQDECVNQIINK